MGHTIAFLGTDGSFSHQASKTFAPDYEPLGCPSFKHALEAVKTGKAELAMIPIENSRAGRVNDVYHLLPGSDVFIQSEHYLPIRHMLIGQEGADVSDVKTAASHPMALAQCRQFLDSHGITPMAAADTATATKELLSRQDASHTSIGSRFAADHFGLQVLASDIQDTDGNTTRFITLGTTPPSSVRPDGEIITTLIFEVRSIPSALFKALGGFATNGVNLTKIESYYVGDMFDVAKFYCDFEGHPADPNVTQALEEVRFYSKEVSILGAYPADGFRSR